MAEKRLIVRAKTIVTCDTDAPQNGMTFDALGRIDDAAMVIEDGIVTAIGPSSVRSAGERRTRLARLRRRSGLRRRARASALCRRSGTRFCGAASRRTPALGMRYTIERTREALLDPETFYATISCAAPAHDVRARHDDARNENRLRAAQARRNGAARSDRRARSAIPACRA